MPSSQVCDVPMPIEATRFLQLSFLSHSITIFFQFSIFRFFRISRSFAIFHIFWLNYAFNLAYRFSLTSVKVFWDNFKSSALFTWKFDAAIGDGWMFGIIRFTLTLWICNDDDMENFSRSTFFPCWIIIAGDLIFSPAQHQQQKKKWKSEKLSSNVINHHPRMWLRFSHDFTPSPRHRQPLRHRTMSTRVEKRLHGVVRRERQKNLIKIMSLNASALHPSAHIFHSSFCCSSAHRGRSGALSRARLTTIFINYAKVKNARACWRWKLKHKFGWHHSLISQDDNIFVFCRERTATHNTVYFVHSLALIFAHMIPTAALCHPPFTQKRRTALSWQCEFQIFHARVEGNLIFFFIHIHDDAGLCCCRVVYTISERLPNQTKHKSRPVSSPHRLLLLWLFVIVFVRHEDLRFSYFSSFSRSLSSSSINIHAHTYSLILTMWFFSPSNGKAQQQQAEPQPWGERLRHEGGSGRARKNH